MAAKRAKTGQDNTVVRQVRQRQRFQRLFMSPDANDDVRTPRSLYDALDVHFHFSFDPCPFHGQQGSVDGLSCRWGSVSFVNPPFSDIAPWVRKAVDEQTLYGSTSVLLVPAHTQTSYWSQWVWPFAAQLWFIAGRVRFDGYARQFPLPLVCVVYGDPSILSTSQTVDTNGYRFHVVQLNPRADKHSHAPC